MESNIGSTDNSLGNGYATSGYIQVNDNMARFGPGQTPEPKEDTKDETPYAIFTAALLAFIVGFVVCTLFLADTVTTIDMTRAEVGFLNAKLDRMEQYKSDDREAVLRGIRSIIKINACLAKGGMANVSMQNFNTTCQDRPKPKPEPKVVPAQQFFHYVIHDSGPTGVMRKRTDTSITDVTVCNYPVQQDTNSKPCTEWEINGARFK